MLTSDAESYESARRLAAGVALDQVLDATEPDSWIDLDVEVRGLARRRPELFHSNASPSGRRMYWDPESSAPTVTWSRKPGDAEIAIALCHPSGLIREAALSRVEGRPALLSLIVIRCADWVGPVRERARGILAETPPDRLAAHAPLILRVGRRSRGGFAQELLTHALRGGPAARTEALLDSRDRATSRLVHRVAVERRLLPAPRLARTAAHHRDVVVQNLCAEAAAATLGEGTSEGSAEVVAPLLESRQPRVRSAGVTALRRTGRHSDAEPYLTDRSAVVRACARWVLRQGGTDPAPLYRALCADPANRPAAAAGLGECGVREDAELIRPLLTHPAPGVRASAVAGLRALDAVRIDDVRPLLDDPSAVVVRQATAALLPWADRLPLELLRARLTEDRPRHQRIAAIRLLRAAGAHTPVVTDVADGRCSPTAWPAHSSAV
ncbi:HEAT repeat domain-containing protein [Streptomyces sp. NPDC056738]|uniref:HEAT repeat domain-containing protein n=1 Tax=Streptomyces sp. NPDC056738 TaxID=3345933 RepID=UPI0036A2C820